MYLTLLHVSAVLMSHHAGHGDSKRITIILYSNTNSQLDATITNFNDNYNQLNMFRTIISAILRSTRLCLQPVVKWTGDAAWRPLLPTFSPALRSYSLHKFSCQDYYYALYPMLRMRKLHGLRSGERGGHNRMPIFLSPKTLYKSKLFSLFVFLSLGLFSHLCH